MDNHPKPLRLPGFLQHPTRHLFFTGKGGVGKTSTACASALALAEAGHRVPLVSTDPASNLDEMLGTALGDHHRPSRWDSALSRREGHDLRRRATGHDHMLRGCLFFAPETIKAPVTFAAGAGLL